MSKVWNPNTLTVIKVTLDQQGQPAQHRIEVRNLSHKVRARVPRCMCMNRCLMLHTVSHKSGWGCALVVWSSVEAQPACQEVDTLFLCKRELACIQTDFARTERHLSL